MAIRILPTQSKRLGKGGKGALSGFVELKTVGFVADTRAFDRMARAIAAEIVKALRAAIESGKAGDSPVPALSEATLKRRKKYAAMWAGAGGGHAPPWLQDRYPGKAQKSSSIRSIASFTKGDTSGLDMTTPLHFTGGFARSLRAFPVSKTKHQYRVVAARMYTPLLQRYLEKGITIMTVPGSVASHAGTLVGGYLEKLFVTAVGVLGAIAETALDTATAALEFTAEQAEGDQGGGEGFGVDELAEFAGAEF